MYLSCDYHMQVAVIEGTRLGVKYMSTKKGGRGGTIINVASMGGQSASKQNMHHHGTTKVGQTCCRCFSSIFAHLLHISEVELIHT